MKNIRKILFLTVFLACISNFAFAKGFVRQNNFMDKSGVERRDELKRWQALMNLPVTGTLDAKTKTALYTENYEAYDEIKNPPSKGYWIAINKSRRTLTLYKGSKSQGKYPVTLGTNATPTPSAKAKIQNKHKNPAWGGMGGKYTPVDADDPNNPLGERWMGLGIPGQNGYGIHGNIKPHQIGGYYSNGCIRMFNYDIENYLFPIVPVGAPVWLGTDNELESWGLYQYSRIMKEKPAPKPVEKPVEKTVEHPMNAIDNVNAGELLEF